MKVLFDAHQLGRRQTGNETYIRALLTEFADMPSLDLTPAVERSALGDPAIVSFAVRRVPRSGTLRLISMAVAARLISADVMHAVYFAPYLSGMPIVLTVHDISYEIYPEFFSRVERLRARTLIRDGVRRARFVITVSEASRHDLVQRYGVPEERVLVIHNGVARRFLTVPPRDVQPIGDRPLRILALGTLQPRKNLMRLMEAVRIVALKRPVTLRVVGPDGFQAGAIRDALDGSASATIAGFLSDAQLVNEYVEADMLVYPSIYEGFGLPVLEAMACSTPVITSTGGSLPEVAGDAAIVVDPFDVSAIANSILRLADDVQLRRELVKKGLVRAGSYSWAASAQAHAEAYQKAAQG